MAARQKLSSDFGIFSRIAPDKIQTLQKTANALVSAHACGDIIAWNAIIESANKGLTKFERGMFSAFALALIEGNNPQ